MGVPEARRESRISDSCRITYAGRPLYSTTAELVVHIEESMVGQPILVDWKMSSSLEGLEVAEPSKRFELHLSAPEAGTNL
jgi:hypothetical protein